jgi:predicted DNA-binding helix-hairpin-helix protein
MDVIQKMAELSVMMAYEPAEETSPGDLTPCTVLPTAASALTGQTCQPAKMNGVPIHHAVMPGGKSIALLKTLQTSACEKDCYYCCFRAGRDFRRTTFTPDELAQGFMAMVQARVVSGLFLSSGVAGGGLRTQDRLIDTAEILRHKLGFRGYLHLKIMPGAEQAQVERAMMLSDRVSINLEAPNTACLSRLAPHKMFMEELLRPLQWVEAIRRTQPAELGWNGRWPSSTTQFVVGGAGETDLELLTTTAYLNRAVHLARAYYSGFSPVKDTPMENLPAINPWRQHRLYQASFLLRDYGFDLEDIPFQPGGNLPVEVDPKLAWARANLSDAPVEINQAERLDLLRIPGIGPKTAQTILAARHTGRLHSLGELRGLGVQVNRAAPFLLLDGHRPPEQLSLW